MKLITVEAAFAPEDQPNALGAIEAQADTVRSMAGCVGYAVYQTNSEIAIVQKWDNMDAFEGYRTSSTFAELIAKLKPLMSAPPVTTVANVDT